jgi:hypothetical protein
MLLEELEGRHWADAADGARVVAAAKDAKVDEGLPAHLYRVRVRVRVSLHTCDGGREFSLLTCARAGTRMPGPRAA